MLKRIGVVSLLMIVLFFVAYFSHAALNTAVLSFSLLDVYLFHLIAVLIVYAVIEFVAENLPSQAGYAYLMFMFFKLGIFLLLFQKALFLEQGLTQSEKIGLVVPLFLFLTAEAMAIGKLLNSK